MLSIKALVQGALRLVNKFAWIGPLAVRLVIGFAFAHNGWGKLHSLDNITEFFTQLGIPMPHANAVFVSCVECFGGVLLMLGLGTRIAALLLIGVMAVAILTSVYPNADATVLDSIELSYLLVFVWLVFAGGGAASLDHLIARRSGAAHRVGEAA